MMGGTGRQQLLTSCFVDRTGSRVAFSGSLVCAGADDAAAFVDLADCGEKEVHSRRSQGPMDSVGRGTSLRSLLLRR